MSHKIIRTELEGYPIRHDEITDILNDAMINLKKANFNIKNSLLEKIGKAASPLVEHVTHISTKEGYTWFGGLIYSIGKAKVAILFPWAQDWDNPISAADSSISVYSTEKVRYKEIKSLIEKIAHQVERLHTNNLLYSSH